MITQEAEAQLQQLQEANFLTTITFRLFEDTLSMVTIYVMLLCLSQRKSRFQDMPLHMLILSPLVSTLLPHVSLSAWFSDTV